MAIFNSYVKLPEGTFSLPMMFLIPEMDETNSCGWNTRTLGLYFGHPLKQFSNNSTSHVLLKSTSPIPGIFLAVKSLMLLPGASKKCDKFLVVSSPGDWSSCEVYSRGIVGLTLEAWLDACRGLSLPFSRHEAKTDLFQERWLVATLWLWLTKSYWKWPLK